VMQHEHLGAILVSPRFLHATLTELPCHSLHAPLPELREPNKKIQPRRPRAPLCVERAVRLQGLRSVFEEALGPMGVAEAVKHAERCVQRYDRAQRRKRSRHIDKDCDKENQPPTCPFGNNGSHQDVPARFALDRISAVAGMSEALELFELFEYSPPHTGEGGARHIHPTCVPSLLSPRSLRSLEESLQQGLLLPSITDVVSV